MMEYYTYRIVIESREIVKGQKRNPKNETPSELCGSLTYNDESKARIQQLCDDARDNKLEALDNVRALGENLFRALFNDVLSHDFFTYYENTKQTGALLRVELDVDERTLPDLAALPWEFMRVPRSNKNYSNVWIGTEPNLIFSRRRTLWRSPEPIQLQVDERLRIALVVAAPEKLGTVKYEEVWENLKNLEKEPDSRVELSMIKQATAKEIDRILDEQKPHIFHLIGHGRFKDENQNNIGQIALVETTGEVRWTDAYVFSELFNRHQPKIVMLQACEGATISSSEAFVGVASQVVQQNIPVVIAMQYNIPNFRANQFALTFYRRLFEQNDFVGKAVQEARRAIALDSGYRSRDFATPVLFMSVRDNRLFKELSVTEAFEKFNTPIVVVYGDIPEEEISSFHRYFQGNQGNLYLNVRITKCDTIPETLFEIVQELGDQCIEQVPESDEKKQLSNTLSKLKKFRQDKLRQNKLRQNEKRDDSFRAQLSAFIDFTVYVLYPDLQAVCKTYQSLTIAFEGFEKIEASAWVSQIRTFILESLLNELTAVHPRFMLFTRKKDKPPLFAGSGEEYPLNNIKFHKIQK